jgi:hypothetical protein
MGLWIRYGNENAVFTVGWKKFAETKKGAAAQVESESDVGWFFDIEGVVHHEFLRQGQTVNRWYYLEVLICLRENVRREKDLNCVETTTPGSSMMTMRQLMHRS